MTSLVVAAGIALGPEVASADPLLQPCWVDGLEFKVQCGSLARPLNPAAPDATQIDIHFVVIPALSRAKAPDPVFFLAGGPGQSAIDLAGMLSQLFARLGNRHDLVLVDQRGTGRSAPLKCEEGSPTESLARAFEQTVQMARLRECLRRLTSLPHGDLRFYTTEIAMADLEAVRDSLAYPAINIIGGSYGTRAALDYMRQYPDHVRTVVIDGVAPPDMVLPQSVAPDSAMAMQSLLDYCADAPDCQRDYPRLSQQWIELLRPASVQVTVRHPVTGAVESLLLDRDDILNMVRGALYVPLLASTLPLAIDRASHGDFAPLVGLGSALASGESAAATGMHFSVICAEDFPRLTGVADDSTAPFGSSFARIYLEICPVWPRGEVSEDFYRIHPGGSPVLVLSGGLDPVTPPRHGERVTALLGDQATHVIVGNAGHGVMGQGCAADVITRFIETADIRDAEVTDPACLTGIPRPGAFTLPAAESGEQ
ncbi:MAG: alpha/beta hydrolase [Gammaproteobacteria bacterium]|nr:alpha/beta hydrolase [Gammaproteobacteria bacterium]MCP5146396.1 alpha/beta hydrolase [Gammaproteobacteria bacterium]